MKTKSLFFVSMFVGCSLGEATVITGDSINFGWQNQVVDGANSIAVGAENTVDFRSMGLGWLNNASNNSLALGLGNVTSNYSVSFGRNNFQSNDSAYSIVDGYYNTVESAAQYSAVFGYGNILQGQDGSFIAGIQNNMLFPSTKDGLGNIILGEYNTLDLVNSASTYARSTVLIGYENSSLESKAYAIGVGNIAQKETVTLGTYGATISNASLIVGTGTSPTSRSNGLVVLKNGNVVVNGQLTAGGQQVLTTVGGAVPYLTTAAANSTYLKQTDAAASYLTPTTADSNYVRNDASSLALGYATSGNEAFAIGNYAHADGDYSIAFGSGYGGYMGDTVAEGAFSMALGTGADASGYWSTAIGNSTANGDNALALGSSTASGEYSVSIGGASAEGYAAVAIGISSASGDYATAMGYATYATGKHSTAMGETTTANAYGSTVIGRGNIVQGDTDNWVATDDLFVVGNGTSSVPSNAMVVKKNGDTTVSGNAVIKGTSVLQGNATLKGNTVLEGNVTLTQPQGDISMGIYQ